MDLIKVMKKSDMQKMAYSAAQEERQRKLQEYLTAKGKLKSTTKLKSNTKPYLKDMNTTKPILETTVRTQPSKVSKMKENMPPNMQKGRCEGMQGKTTRQNRTSLQLSDLNVKSQRTKTLATSVHSWKPGSATLSKPIKSEQTETKYSKDHGILKKECALLQMVAKEENPRFGQIGGTQKNAPTEILVCTSLGKSGTISTEAAQQTGEGKQPGNTSVLTAQGTFNPKPWNQPLKRSSVSEGMCLPVNRSGIGLRSQGPVKANTDRLRQSSKSTLSGRTSIAEAEMVALAKKKREQTYRHATLNSARSYSSGQHTSGSTSRIGEMHSKTIPSGNRVSTSNNEKINGRSFPCRQPVTGTTTSVTKVGGRSLPSRQQTVGNTTGSAKNGSKYCPPQEPVGGSKTHIVKSNGTFPSRPRISGNAKSSKREHVGMGSVKQHPSGSRTSFGRVNSKSFVGVTRSTISVAKCVGTQQPVKAAQQIGKAAVFRGTQRDFKVQGPSLSSTRGHVQSNCGPTRLETVGVHSQNTASKTLRFASGVSQINTQGGCGEMTTQDFTTKCKAAELLNDAVGPVSNSATATTVLHKHPEGDSCTRSVQAQGEHWLNESGQLVGVVGPATPTVQNHEVKGFLSEREKRRKKLEEWLSAKKKQYKRPAMLLPTPKKTPRAKLNDSFWVNFEEDGDEHCSLVERINQVLTQCLKLIQQGVPSEKLLGILSRIPSAEKFAQYWICKARLSERDGCFDIELYERAVNAGAQPIQDLRAVVIDILKNMSKTSAALPECVFDEIPTCDSGEEEDVPVAVQKASKEKVPKSNPKLPVTHSRIAQKGSSVIKFQVGVIPRVKESPLPSISQDMKLLTPVRRSLRIENACEHYPNMLKEHDPVITCLNELLALEEVSCYVYRKNEALPEEEEEEDPNSKVE
ncbi:cytoskeleton-associated protein 2-like [Protopterus annectens]|uniref:cytoskeleton-associated protein 2-like n=1 Tax=Protopterus annectens TaxID=7888 RepID=UPI001CFC12FA|nr:cytoskeleton-associated protein 2-like [Protopterus annectens]